MFKNCKGIAAGLVCLLLFSVVFGASLIKGVIGYTEIDERGWNLERIEREFNKTKETLSIVGQKSGLFGEIIFYHDINNDGVCDFAVVYEWTRDGLYPIQRLTCKQGEDY